MVALQTPLFQPTSRSKPARRSDQRTRRVAVVLNANARRVDRETVRWVRGVVPPGDLFLSNDIDEAPRLAEHILTEGYDAVLWGGGDGTFATGLAALASAAGRRGLHELPEVGVLRLGTGNAMADAIGAGPATPEGLADDLRRARVAPARRHIAMLNIEGKPAMFAGFGLDAQILDDFGATMNILRRTHLADKIRSAAVRYGIAVVTRSVPRFLTSQRPEVVAVNRGSPALRVGLDGEPLGPPIPAGRVLWRGVATLAAAGTIPFFGLGLKAFPHADRRPDRFQLRVTDVGAAAIVPNLPKIWRGRWQHSRMQDFLVDEVELVLSRPAPFQSNGDLWGDRERVTMSLWDRPVAVV